VRHLQTLGTKVGLRFTMTELNAHDLPNLLQLMREDEGVDKFYFSHLNYAGRGNIHRGKDARHIATRAALDLLYDTAWADAQAGGQHEYVTGNNDADGVYLLQWVRAPPAALDGRRARSAWSPGAATRRASTSPTSTTWATCTPTPCGGTTRWATCGAAVL
jgi:MoaA/NifB/PqqE/SkfB family radical SAM enzyme